MNKVKSAIAKLSEEYESSPPLLWQNAEDDRSIYKRLWPGEKDEQIVVRVSNHIEEEIFHRQDYFFFHYAYENSYTAISDMPERMITVHENECYIGQPFHGHGFGAPAEPPATVVEILLHRDAFIKELLPAISDDFSLFHFFLDPEKDPQLDGYIHLALEEWGGIRRILEMMMVEYANQKEGTQSILKSLALTLLTLVAREYKWNMQKNPRSPLAYKIIEYMNDHFGAVTLKDVAEHFSYHPNYISSLLHRETGHTFSEHLLESRMRSAVALLKNSRLSIEEIAGICGYKNSSGFYRAFHSYYGVPPREYVKGKEK